MNRRLLLGLIGLSPLALISSKIPANNPIINILIKRWKKSKEYTMIVLEAMPEDDLEFQPTKEQMSFAQQFMHIGFTNNAFIGILMDSKTYPDFEALMEANFFLERPDPINLFQPDNLQIRDAKENKALVSKYVADTFDYVISSLANLSDEMLARGENKEKPWYLEGHSNLDLILRSESHTAHHRAQAIGYLRMNGIQPPGYSKNNTL
ncbi:DinB family protein [Maribacter halichondriae]|uniref:DinB family protein n=1 Tax=Maribacter halichondriae TaxID=2980554 RepID=UPI002358C3D2|nr:DinB family protein [Maribacter sp. Hal144]